MAEENEVFSDMDQVNKAFFDKALKEFNDRLF
jgi:hypothetical protein